MGVDPVFGDFAGFSSPNAVAVKKRFSCSEFRTAWLQATLFRETQLFSHTETLLLFVLKAERQTLRLLPHKSDRNCSRESSRTKRYISGGIGPLSEHAS